MDVPMRRSASASVSSVPRIDPMRELASLFPPRAPRATDEPIEWDSLEYAAPGCSLLAPWDVGAPESLSSIADVDEHSTRQLVARTSEESMLAEAYASGEQRLGRVGCVESVDGVVTSGRVERDGEWGALRAGGVQRRWDESFVLQCDAEPFCVMPYVDLELDLVPPRAEPPDELSAGARREYLKKDSLEGGVQPSETETTNS